MHTSSTSSSMHLQYILDFSCDTNISKAFRELSLNNYSTACESYYCVKHYYSRRERTYPAYIQNILLACSAIPLLAQLTTNMHSATIRSVCTAFHTVWSGTPTGTELQQECIAAVKSQRTSRFTYFRVRPCAAHSGNG
jgi:hypothetical protein